MFNFGNKPWFKSIINILKFAIKATLFFLVVLSIINEYLIYSDLGADTVAVYTRLSDFNEYLIAIGFTLATSFAFFAFGLSQNRPLLISIDLLLSLMILFYVLLNYKPWIDLIPSDVEGYQYLLSNIRFLFYSIWAVSAFCYISIISVKSLYVYFFGVQPIHESSKETFMKQMHGHKQEKLLELQMTAFELEGERYTVQEYQEKLRQLYLDKVRLHESY